MVSVATGINWYPKPYQYTGAVASSQAQKTPEQQREDVFISSNGTCTDGKDDGKISFKEGVKSFFKGVISPITNMFKSPGNFIKSAVMIAGCAALCVATGGAATPFLVAAGVATGGFQIAKGAIGAATAENDADAKAAWENIGSGTGAVAASAAGAKAAASAGGIQGAKSMNAFQATAACIKNAPRALGSVVNALKPSQIGASIGSVASAARGLFGNIRGLFSRSTVATKGDVIYTDFVDTANPQLTSNNAAQLGYTARPQLTSSNTIYAGHTPQPLLQAPVSKTPAELASLLSDIRYSRLASY